MNAGLLETILKIGLDNKNYQVLLPEAAAFLGTKQTYRALGKTKTKF